MRLLPRVSQPPNDTDRADAMAFMSLHAPEYANFVKGLPNDDVRTNIENTLAGAYATYQQLKLKEPDLYGVILKRIAVEDRLFALRIKARNADDDAARTALEPAIRAAATEWCDLSLQERRLRLDRLERTVKQEQNALAVDQGKRSLLIEDRVAQVMHGRGGWPGGGPPGRGDGGGGGRGGPADSSGDGDGGRPPG